MIGNWTDFIIKADYSIKGLENNNYFVHESSYVDENVEIGNHSHSHEYLVDESPEVIEKDILNRLL